MIRRLTSPPLGLLLLGLVLAAFSVLGAASLHGGVVSDAGWSLPVPALAVLFAMGEVFVLHLHVRRQRRSVSLSEVPLVLGLFLAAPLVLLVGRLLGAALALVLHRKQRGVKLALNLVMFSAETIAALLVFRALVPADDDSPWAWAAAYAAASVASATSHLSVSLIIAMYERVLHPVDLLKAASSGIAAALAVATFGLLAELALDADPRSSVLLVLVAAMLLVGYRAYSNLSERHLALERLHQFGQVLAASPEVDEVLRSLLLRASELLRSVSAEVTFMPDRESGRGLRVRLLADGTLERTVVEDLRAVDPVSAKVLDEGRPVLLERGDDSAAYLADRGLREAVLVPLHGDVGVVGTLAVADRTGENGTFGRADVALLQKVGDSAGAALVKGQQLDELRQGALHDPLTGLPNRAQVVQALEAAEASPGAPYTVFLLDLNGFKAVNDTLGHERGDQLLCDVARRMRQAVPPGVLVARLGGDEFVVVAEVPDAGAAASLASAVVHGITHEVTDGDRVLPIGTALGYVVAPEDGTGAAELLRRADAAMYAGKRARTGPRRWTSALEEAAAVPAPRETVERRSASGSRT